MFKIRNPNPERNPVFRSTYLVDDRIDGTRTDGRAAGRQQERERNDGGDGAHGPTDAAGRSARHRVNSRGVSGVGAIVRARRSGNRRDRGPSPLATRHRQHRNGRPTVSRPGRRG